MITIRCETGDDVEVAADTLAFANLSQLNLHRALLEDQVLRGANMSGSDLRSAWLERSDLTDAILVGAKFPACNASLADFTRANLSKAFMRCGIFERARFSGANLRGADVGGARFAGAFLHSADLTSAIDLDQADLWGARADEYTKWPNGYEPLKHGVIFDRIVLS